MNKGNKNLELKEGVSKIIMRNIAEIAVDTGQSPFTVKEWVYKRPHRFNYPHVLKSVKKHTGLTKDQIFKEDGNDSNTSGV